MDEENIFLSRMPGAWKLDKVLSDILAPNTWKSFDVDQLILTRNDSTVESFYGEECDKGDFTLHMTGIAEGTNLSGNETTEYGEIYINYWPTLTVFLFKISLSPHTRETPSSPILCPSWTTSQLSLTVCWPPGWRVRMTFYSSATTTMGKA